MPRTLYARGAHGETVKTIQRALLSAGFDPQGIDGGFGTHTAAAVRLLQTAQRLPVTGIVDETTWQRLMHAPIPETYVRCLDLTAAFEGHGYSLAQGNWDGAWLTWGIIGFTMKYGDMQKIILEIFQREPDLVKLAFGDETNKLIDVMTASPRRQKKWAMSVTVGGRVAEPWRTAFDAFGRLPEVQELQRKSAREDYFVAACDAAREQGLASELGLALSFDIEVQNGGITRKTRAEICAKLDVRPSLTERDRRVVIADAVADASPERFRQDVRRRKLTIANGSGDAHGAHFVLENWGLDDSPAPELA
ncbi:MAG: peptidoglycan-binding protein [Candidatus Binataceae bacterium]